MIDARFEKASKRRDEERRRAVERGVYSIACSNQGHFTAIREGDCEFLVCQGCRGRRAGSTAEGIVQARQRNEQAPSTGESLSGPSIPHNGEFLSPHGWLQS